MTPSIAIKLTRLVNGCPRSIASKCASIYPRPEAFAPFSPQATTRAIAAKGAPFTFPQVWETRRTDTLTPLAKSIYSAVRRVYPFLRVEETNRNNKQQSGKIKQTLLRFVRFLVRKPLGSAVCVANESRTFVRLALRPKVHPIFTISLVHIREEQTMKANTLRIALKCLTCLKYFIIAILALPIIPFMALVGAWVYSVDKDAAIKEMM